MTEDEEASWIHLLFRGDRLSLRGDQSDDIVNEFKSRNLIATTIPILQFRYKNLEELSSLLKVKIDQRGRVESINGLIITSPRVVEALKRAIETDDSNNLILGELNSEFVFVVGDKSARECESRLGLKCNAESAQTGNSRSLANYIKTVCGKGRSTINLLYPKGSLADNLIEDTLASEDKIRLKPIVVYETNVIENLADVSIEAIQGLGILAGLPKLIFNMIFFSPSGVDSFLKMGQGPFINRLKSYFPNSDIELRFSSIGKTTEAALLFNNIQVYCVSEKPNPVSLVECIMKTQSG